MHGVLQQFRPRLTQLERTHFLRHRRCKEFIGQMFLPSVHLRWQLVTVAEVFSSPLYDTVTMSLTCTSTITFSGKHHASPHNGMYI